MCVCVCVCSLLAVVPQASVQFSDGATLNTQLASLNLPNTTTQIVVRALK